VAYNVWLSEPFGLDIADLDAVNLLKIDGK